MLTKLTSAQEHIKKIILQIVLGPILIGTICSWTFYIILMKARAVNLEVMNAQQAITTLSEFNAKITIMESSMRGFLLSQQIQFLEPYYDASNSLEANYEKLLSTFKSDQQSIKQLNELGSLTRDWINYSKNKVSLDRNPNIRDKDEHGFAKMGRIRDLILTLLRGQKDHLLKKDSELQNWRSIN